MTTLAFRVDAVNPAHVYVTVFAGENDQRARAGSLVFRHGEWAAFKKIVDRGDIDDVVEYRRLELVPAGR